MSNEDFKREIQLGIPNELPEPKPYDTEINHAPKRKEILSSEEKKLALRNALRYFPKSLHAQLAPEFAEELKTYGRIYMYRYRPSYEMYARPIDEYPAKSRGAASARIDYLRRQRRGVPKLGAISFGDEIFERNDRRADACDVFGPSARTVSVAQECATRRGDQRNGDS